MTLSERIRQVEQHLSQLAKTVDDTILNHQLNMLVKELNQIAGEAKPDTSSTSENSGPEVKNGCYIFSDHKGFYCPACFDHDGIKAMTTRINSKLRICSVCKTSIKL